MHVKYSDWNVSKIKLVSIENCKREHQVFSTEWKTFLFLNIRIYAFLIHICLFFFFHSCLPVWIGYRSHIRLLEHNMKLVNAFTYYYYLQKKKLQNLYTEFDRERRDDACECFKEQSYPFFFTHKSQLVSQSIVIEISSQKRKIEQVEAKQNEKPIQRRKILYEILLFILFILLWYDDTACKFWNGNLFLFLLYFVYEKVHTFVL